MTCKYCKPGERKWHNSSDNHMRLQLTKKNKSGGKYKSLRMIVHWNSWRLTKELDTKKSSIFNINFCPMCARDLRQVIE